MMRKALVTGAASGIGRAIAERLVADGHLVLSVDRSPDGDEQSVLTDVILAPHAVEAMVEPSDVADTVAFLLTPAGRNFTGVSLPMDLG